jgi:two-component SAPR family response regulator
MFWDIHIPTLTEVVLRCMKSGVFSEYAKELLELSFKRDAILYIERKITALENDSIKAFTNKVISIYGVAHNADFSCSIDIRLLGRFDIAVNEVHIPPEEWKTKKIKGILEYLVLHKGKAVSRDQLMDIFWPDSDKKSAAVSLRAALYELKKVLARYGVKNDGDTPFIHEKTGSLEIRSNNMLSLDVDEFLSLYEESKRKRKNGTDKNQLMVSLKE